MKGWGDGVVQRLHALGLDVAECRTERDRLVFLPDGRLTLRTGDTHIEVALELPTREVSAVRARLGDAERALELSAAIESLPEQFTMGSYDDGRLVPVTHASTDDVRALLGRLEREQRPLWLGWSVPRADALAHAPLLDELVADAAVALGSVLALLAWTPASSMQSAGTDRVQRHRVRRDEDRKGTKRRARARSRDRDHDRDGDVDAEPEAALEREPAPASLNRAALRSALRPGLRSRPPPAIDPRAPVEKGTRVRVLDGPFVGKVGAVQELDGKGGARVMLGLLAVRLDVKDLVACAEGRVRPRLSSSHRKPLPVRS